MNTVTVNSLFGSHEITLNDQGRVDDDVRYAFTAGQCHAFALALQERFPEWELVACWWSDGTWEDAPEDYLVPDGEEVPGHVLLRDPAGRLWDVTGQVEEEDAREIDRDYLFTLANWGAYYEPRVEVARKFTDDWIRTNITQRGEALAHA